MWQLAVVRHPVTVMLRGEERNKTANTRNYVILGSLNTQCLRFTTHFKAT